MACIHSSTEMESDETITVITLTAMPTIFVPTVRLSPTAQIAGWRAFRKMIEDRR